MSAVEETVRPEEDAVAEVLPILPLKETVVFPDSMTPLAVGQERSIQLVDEAVANDSTIALVTTRNAEEEATGAEDIYDVGTAALIHKMIRVPDGTLRILVQGVRRVRLERIVQSDPYLVGEFSDLPDVDGPETEVEALGRNVEALFSRVIGLVPYLPDELQLAAANAEDPSTLANLIATTMRLKTAEKQELLEEADIEARLRKLTVILNRELEVLELGTKIQSQVQSEMEHSQREYFLRQQLKAIQEELGEGDEQQAEISELRGQIEEARPPRGGRPRRAPRARPARQASARGRRVRRHPRLPRVDPLPALERGHRGQPRPRARAPRPRRGPLRPREGEGPHHRAARRLEAQGGRLRPDPLLRRPARSRQDLARPVDRAVARAQVRPHLRRRRPRRGRDPRPPPHVHRRAPGTILRALRDAGSRNPVFMIDEIDKMGSDWRGDPSSAMLEVLDPAQNSSFRDHYLDLPFDLSKVLFICTANQLETIPPPLQDRMEIIRLSGYTEEEKLGIAKRYLVPKQLEAHGLDAENVKFGDKALRLIISEYTREAGVRNLDREIAAICRKAAAEIASGKRKTARVDERRVRSWLGRQRFRREIRKRTSDPGVATGLAVTPVGGDILFIEATAVPGEGRLIVTGQLGEVMRESAQAALSWVRGHATDLGLEDDWFAHRDVHIHVPAGAVPKDGPSAGIAMATALSSLAMNRPVSEEVAMTGEITLTGQVLPIGGLRDKVLAAQRAGISTVILPKENEADLDDLPRDVRKQMTFVLADHVDDVMEAAFPGADVVEFSSAARG